MVFFLAGFKPGESLHNLSRNTMKYKQISVPSQHPRQLFMEWYHAAPPGQTLRDSEASYLLNSLQLTYCQRILQVGRLDVESRYIPEEFTRNFLLLTDAPSLATGVKNQIQAEIDAWPVACESVDTLILPHLLEFEADPHSVLSEAERVLKPEGRLFILGFNPWSLQSLLRYRRRSSADFRNTHFIGSSQVIEWLNLIKFEAEFSAGFGFPSRAAAEPQSAWQKSIACLAPAYAVKAIKRTWTPIPIKQAWLSTPELIPGQAIAPPLMRKPGNN
jgi:SAM-dependent methyltransferase